MSAENGRKKMETQFYEDAHNPWLSKKKCMTLDLDTGKRKLTAAVLSTPDVQMLKLASPELEKMIISQQGNICTTPTPTQFICPKNVTEEQAAFAQGFVEALQSLHQRNDSGDSESVVSDDESSVDQLDLSDPTTTYQQQVLNPHTTISSMTTAATSIYNPAMPTTTTLPGSTVSLSSRNSMPTDSTAITRGWQTNVEHIKQEPVCEEPQTVPVYHATANPPMSPIDMETQERIKAERKRLRNRIAASKCRKRKLERIARLEDKVKDLKTQNSDLTTTATKLREQVCALKQSVMEHVKSGCQVMLAQQLAF
ncbi:transcription factor AP-1-like [Lytechinus variegatus]|uniref:transcription factor AP-1-like n=1 Tax=Lytechinus variegatus TaxID=7654 RepID=UPI001BB0E6D4|nr:transcription factor AP-1-like [Lytechinus variegatus]